MTAASLPHFDHYQPTLDWQPDPALQAKFQLLYEAILIGNQQLNLTRLTTPDEFWEKHLWDSLRGLKPWLRQPELDFKIIDIGTGGGFPGVPAALVLPLSQVTLLDSTRKKVNFLASLAQTLELPQIKTITARAEAVGQQKEQRDRYDLALIRAVGPATVCAEYSLPFIKIGGTAVLYRGQWSDDEAQSLERAVEQLGGAVTQVDSFTTPLTQGTRNCIHIQKVEATPAQFPRPVGIPVQKPLA